MHDQIGKGYSSRVYKGKDDLTGETVAIKVNLNYNPKGYWYESNHQWCRKVTHSLRNKCPQIDSISQCPQTLWLLSHQ